jgi:hypothetical protein
MAVGVELYSPRSMPPSLVVFVVADLPGHHLYSALSLQG